MEASEPVMDPPRTPTRTFTSLRVRNFRLFIFGQLVSTTGTWMQLTAGPWLVLKLSNNATMVGLDAALSFVPMMVGVPGAA
jgi:hypothetical protein